MAGKGYFFVILSLIDLKNEEFMKKMFVFMVILENEKKSYN